MKKKSAPQIVMHLSHTDILRDAKILRTIDAVAEECSVIALGVQRSNSNDSVDNPPVAARIEHVSPARVFNRPSTKEVAGAHPKRLSAGEKMLLGFRFFFKAMRMQILYRPSLIHCHDPIALGFGLTLTMFSRCRLIYDSHELASERHHLSRWRKFTVKGIETLSSRTVALVIVVSPSIQKWYAERYKNTEVAVVLNSPNWTTEEIKDAVSVGEKANSRVRFIYVGNLEAGRGIEHVVDIFARERLTNSELAIFGSGRLYKTIEKVAESSQLISISPPVRHKDLIRKLSEADFGLCLIENISLSYNFSLPNKIFEYAFSGLTCLVTPRPDLETLVVGLDLGYVIEDGRQAILKVVKQIDSGLVKKKQVSQVSLRQVSWSVQSEILQSHYRRLLGKDAT